MNQPDPAEQLRLIHEAQQRVRRSTTADSRLLFAAWGVAWLVGFLVLWLSARSTGTVPAGPAWPAFGVLLLAAMAVTIVHSVQRGRGLRGPEARAGVLWGWSWMIGFLAYPFIIAGISRAGASAEIIALVATSVSCVVVGLMYLGGGACFRDHRLYALGVWILLTGGVSTLAGIPGSYLVLALAGGGGFLAWAVVETVLVARRRRHAVARDPAAAVGHEGPRDD